MLQGADGLFFRLQVAAHIMEAVSKLNLLTGEAVSLTDQIIVFILAASSEAFHLVRQYLTFLLQAIPISYELPSAIFEGLYLILKPRNLQFGRTLASEPADRMPKLYISQFWDGGSLISWHTSVLSLLFVPIRLDLTHWHPSQQLVKRHPAEEQKEQIPQIGVVLALSWSLQGLCLYPSGPSLASLALRSGRRLDGTNSPLH